MEKHLYSSTCGCQGCKTYEWSLADVTRRQALAPKQYHPTIPRTPRAMKAFKQEIVFDPPPNR